MKAVHRRAAACIACFGVWVGTSGPIRDVQGEDLTLATATRPAPNAVDEPRADRFSLDKAVAFLDQASLEWTASRKCFTCHTNYAYLMARPAVSAENTAHREVRAELEKLVTGRWAESGPRWDAEVVMTAAALAINDRATTGKLHAITRQALDRMWTVQRGDGGFNWLKCKWPPMESDDHFGATMAAIAVGAAPEDYSKTESARAGLARIKAYFVSEPAATVHHRAMLVWAGSYLPELVDGAARDATIDEIRSLQKEDGGWALATFGAWERSDGAAQDVASSDGYATGFAVYVLRQAGVPADAPEIQRGVAWLKANQRASGRWFTRSLFKDGNHFISHAGSAFAVMALAACDVK
ncbi:MAG: squalene--hopene cyclase [Planctomycetes bacterium]|nr:squalene--hopene cyclase [Planctomycetota bacterium]